MPEASVLVSPLKVEHRALASAGLFAFVTSRVNSDPMKRLRIAWFVALFAFAGAIPAAADDAFPPPQPHVGFYVVHPRVGLSTYFSLSSSWAGTQAPVHVVAKLHASGETCGSDPASDTGKPFASGWLTRSDHHVVWKEWTPATAGSYIVCTWLGDPALATGSDLLTVEPKEAGATPVGALVAALTSKTPTGPARAVFPTAPQRVYARFALRGVKRGALVTIVFRDTNGKSIVTHARSNGIALTWYGAQVTQERLQERLGYWSVSVRVGTRLLGRIHFLIPASYPTIARGGQAGPSGSAGETGVSLSQPW
jgi:hypothetical protein